MIKSFRCKETEKIADGRYSRRLTDIQRRAKMRLDRIDAATSGGRTANDQWRVCFEWRDGHAYNVEIVDYH
ncbi:type II toxin-antitoxin system RelE/ParE family toxin [Methylohalobius crimeensis]|uniref:type II toxin-antitoxin system RelE/ParE family toxin n=1 Tax=Methylohalobius crimeensis TaxID=244365 RepID=UPI0003B5CB7C|nr:plasmid maintenance system killer protein [Methylohalobius crimeensis]